MITEIQECQRQQQEIVPDFVNRLCGSVARYVNKTSSLADIASGQFAVLMLRNSKISPDNMNSIVIQLASKVENIKSDIAQVQLSNEEWKYLLGTLSHEEIDEQGRKCSVETKLSTALKILDRYIANTAIFTIDEAVKSLSQVVHDVDIERSNVTSGSILGKRRLYFYGERMKVFLVG